MAFRAIEPLAYVGGIGCAVCSLGQCDTPQDILHGENLCCGCYRRPANKGRGWQPSCLSAHAFVQGPRNNPCLARQYRCPEHALFMASPIFSKLRPEALLIIGPYCPLGGKSHSHAIPFCFPGLRCEHVDFIGRILGACASIASYEGGRAPYWGCASVVRKYVAEHYREPLVLADVAVELGYSANHISHQMQRCEGMGFRRYVNGVRIRESMEYLCDDELLVREVARLVGFRNWRYYSREFKCVTGLTPSQYRQKRGVGA